MREYLWRHRLLCAVATALATVPTSALALHTRMRRIAGAPARGTSGPVARVDIRP
jgi:hypothetical protein